MPNGEEKTRLMQLYLQKYNTWSADPSRPDIRMQYIPDTETTINSNSRIQEALSNLQNNLTTGKNISIQDLQEFFRMIGNEKLISLSDYSLNSIIEKLDKDNIVILESLSSRVGNGFET